LRALDFLFAGICILLSVRGDNRANRVPHFSDK
jgi:hypothetical protein